MKERLKTWLLRRRRSRATKKKSLGRRSAYLLLATLVLLLGAFGLSIKFLYFEPEPDGTEISLNQLNALAGLERLQTATFHDEDLILTGRFAAPPPPEPEPEPKNNKNKKNNNDDAKKGNKNKGGKAKPDEPTREEILTALAPPGSGEYWVPYRDPLTAPLVDLATSSGAEVEIDSQGDKQAVRAVSTFLLPLMILANLFALLFSGSRGGGSGIGDVQMFGTIGKGKAKARRGVSRVTFDDVAGAEEAVTELQEVRDYLINPQKYKDLGALPPKGVLLVGPPGCGKTLMAKAIAGEASVPFFSVAGAEFVESLVGVGAARVRDLFSRVRAVAPAIVFIDELDAAGRKRGTGGGSGGSDEREQTLNQLLVEMDGFDVSEGVVVIGATNRPDILDPALLRPGRFDRHVTVDQPDSEGRQAILELHAKYKPLDALVDFAYLAKRTPGFSGADLANVVNEAALLTIRQERNSIEMPEFEEAIQRVLAGTSKRGRILTEEERRRAAYHEGGHTIVAAASGETDQVHRVSILARGRGIGFTNVRRETDAVLVTKSQLFVKLVIAMGGLASEELVFGEHSTGAEEDLERATDVARDMVGRFGMGSKRRRLLARDIDEFIKGEAALGEISLQTHEEMEIEVDRLIHEAEKEARHILNRYRDDLDRLAHTLMNEETLEGAKLDALLRPVVPAIGRHVERGSGNGHVPSAADAPIQPAAEPPQTVAEGERSEPEADQARGKDRRGPSKGA